MRNQATKRFQTTQTTAKGVVKQPRTALLWIFHPLLLATLLIMCVPKKALSTGLLLGAADGERLHFDVSWSGILAGEASMQMKLTRSGAYEVKAKLATTGMVRLLHALDEMMKAKGWRSGYGRFHAQRFIKDQRKKGRKKLTTYYFDPEMHQVKRIRHKIGRKATNSIIPLNSSRTVDPLSGFYALRAWPKLLPHSNLHRFIVDGNKIYCLSISIGGSHRLQTALGEFTAFPVKVMVKNSKQFLLQEMENGQEGSIVIWLTDDLRRIPILVEAEIAVGTVTAELVALEDGRGEKK